MIVVRGFGQPSFRVLGENFGMPTASLDSRRACVLNLLRLRCDVSGFEFCRRGGFLNCSTSVRVRINLWSEILNRSKEAGLACTFVLWFGGGRWERLRYFEIDSPGKTIGA